MEHSLAHQKKNIKCPAVLMAGLLEDVSGAQNLQKYLDNHKALNNLWVIILPPSPSPPLPPESELETLGLRVRTF